MISQAERANFLKQCWRARHWKDGVGTLLLPLRLSLYRFRKEVLRPHRPSAPALSGETASPQMPAFSAAIRPIFCEPRHIEASSLSPAALFAEVDAQLRGEYRLAGGRVRALDLAAIDESEDAEDAHAYHRLYWVLRYAQAAFLGHAAARDAMPRELREWMKRGSEDSPVARWPYTIAERIGSLTSALFWIDRGGAPDLACLAVPIKRQIGRDALRLSSNVEFGLGLHNHLLNDARGLFLAGTALAGECPEAANWREQAFTIWDEYFPKLVLEDGTFAEQSSHYHLLLCRTALEYFLACRRANHMLPEGFENRMQRMFDLANELVRPDGSLPRFGHNSPDRTAADLSGLMAAAFHFGLLTHAPRDRSITPLTLFYCGATPALPCPVEPKSLRLFPAGGFAMVRSNAFRASLIAHGDGRDGAGPHGDAGRGSYELCWDDDVLIREPGSFFSTADSRAAYYQGAEAQNVTSLDGLAPAIDKQDERFLASWYRPEGGAWKTFENGKIEFRCEAFSRLHPDIVLFRSWHFAQDDLLAFEERIEGSARVQFESRICLGNAAWDTRAPIDFQAAPKFQWQGADGRSVEMTIQAPPAISLTTQPCTFLPEYGIEQQGRQLVLQGSQKLPFSWTIQWKLRKAA